MINSSLCIKTMPVMIFLTSMPLSAYWLFYNQYTGTERKSQLFSAAAVLLSAALEITFFVNAVDVSGAILFIGAMGSPDPVM